MISHRKGLTILLRLKLQIWGRHRRVHFLHSQLLNNFYVNFNVLSCLNKKLYKKSKCFLRATISPKEKKGNECTLCYLFYFFTSVEIWWRNGGSRVKEISGGIYKCTVKSFAGLSKTTQEGFKTSHLSINLAC